MKKLENNKGITLVSLVITIILLIILASIGTYSGIQVVKSAQFTAFSTELKIMQTQVNKLYEEKRNGNDEYVDSLGVEINSDTNIQKQANKVFTASGITDQNGYKYFDTDTIKRLNIEGVEREFFVNINKRSVVSYNGFEYEGKAYYTVNQLDNNSLYNVEYNNTNNWDPSKDSFNIEYNEVEDGKYRITVSNIDYKSGNINKWQVKYKKENEEDWKQSNNYSFIIDELGNYRVKIANNNTESREKQIIVKPSLLPSEFQEVEYIESTGTQYIDTKLYLTLDTEIECDFLFTNISSGYPTPYGCKPPVLGLHPANTNFAYTGFGSNIDITCPENLAEGPKKYIHNKDGIWVNGEKKITYNNTTVVEDKNSNIYIFARMENQAANRYSEIRLYKFIIRRGNNISREFIPVYRIKNNQPGLYDLVNNEFYTNQGTGDFKTGNNTESLIINDL